MEDGQPGGGVAQAHHHVEVAVDLLDRARSTAHVYQVLVDEVDLDHGVLYPRRQEERS